MAKSLETGVKGENFAEKYLRQLGYAILEKNWRSGKHEIDIIARDGDTLVIVEVKTRKSALFGEPEIFVTKSKQKFLVEAANSYLLQKNLDLEVRFDIISILYSKNGYRINHIKEAFYPLL